MKFDDLLAQYLYDNKALRLQGIGTFTLDNKVSVPYEQDKGIYYPIEGLAFTFNPKEETDEDIVLFLVKKLNKITPLVRSDLEYYLSNIRQFINLGKPYTIEGVGTLHKNNQGSYEFTPGNFLPAKEELSPKREVHEEPSYRMQEPSSNAGRIFLFVLIAIAALAALGGIGWGVSTLLAKKNGQTEASALPTDLQTGAIPQENTDTAAPIASESGRPLPALSPTDSAYFKMIFEITPSRPRAVSRTAQLNNLKIKATFDTITRAGVPQYRIFVSKRLLPSDTLRVRDSIAKFFMRKVVIDQ
ncbi:MAG: hypothetical protein JWQ96_301 [Segetibacter sp.]|nr:hypothetical protein [Segetibacter sp.]